MNKTKRIYFGDTWFLPPFRAWDYRVVDAVGKDVVQEAPSLAVAKALAEMLNKTEQTK